jgi:hypothetical protein
VRKQRIEDAARRRLGMPVCSPEIRLLTRWTTVGGSRSRSGGPSPRYDRRIVNYSGCG